MTYVVAIDGPAGSGKGTIAKEVATRLNLVHIDTGAMYRCIALYTIKNNIKKDNIEEIIKSLENIKIKFETKDGKQKVFLNENDVTEEIRKEKVSTIVSDIASIKEVREKMVDVQRKLAKENKVIMEGRDIGTVVFPNANLKIYLDAELEVRAERRYKEYLEKGIDISYDEVKNGIMERDKKDMSRKIRSIKKGRRCNFT